MLCFNQKKRSCPEDLRKIDVSTQFKMPIKNAFPRVKDHDEKIFRSYFRNEIEKYPNSSMYSFSLYETKPENFIFYTRIIIIDIV